MAHPPTTFHPVPSCVSTLFDMSMSMSIPISMPMLATQNVCNGAHTYSATFLPPILQPIGKSPTHRREPLFAKQTKHSTWMRAAHATLPMMSAATPSSSLRTSIFIVTPVFALYAIRTRAATFPPVMVLPYNFSVCVDVDRATSVPSRGWSESVFVSCSVAS